MTKTVDELAIKHANRVSDPELAEWHLRYSSFKMGHASRDEEVMKLKQDIEQLRVNLGVCKNDYWFMTNLLERYSTDIGQAVKDCIERMKFRKGLFNILEVKK